MLAKSLFLGETHYVSARAGPSLPSFLGSTDQLFFASLILLRAKKSWSVEPGNEARPSSGVSQACVQVLVQGILFHEDTRAG